MPCGIVPKAQMQGAHAPCTLHGGYVGMWLSLAARLAAACMETGKLSI